MPYGAHAMAPSEPRATLYLVGDSVMQGMFLTLRNVLGYSRGADDPSAPSGLLCHILRPTATKPWHAPWSRFNRVCLMQTGRQDVGRAYAGAPTGARPISCPGEDLLTPPLERACCAKTSAVDFKFLRLGDALRCLSLYRHFDGRRHVSDTVVVNAGVHHGRGVRLGGHSLATEVHAIIAWHKSQGSASPCVLWRETLPQHFQTLDGAFPECSSCCGRSLREDCWLPNRSDAAYAQCCAPLTSHAGTQPFNNVSTPIVQSAGIPIVRIYTRLAPMWQSHIGCPSAHPGYPDCTHLHPDGAKVAVHALGTAVEHAETACSGRLQGPAATPWHHAESVPGLRLGRTYADWV